VERTRTDRASATSPAPGVAARKRATSFGAVAERRRSSASSAGRRSREQGVVALDLLAVEGDEVPHANIARRAGRRSVGGPQAAASGEDVEGISGSRAIRPSTRANRPSIASPRDRRQHASEPQPSVSVRTNAVDERGQPPLISTARRGRTRSSSAGRIFGIRRGRRGRPRSRPGRLREESGPFRRPGMRTPRAARRRIPDPAHRRPEAEGAIALGALGERGGDDRQAGRRDHGRRRRPCQRASPDQQALGCRRTAQTSEATEKRAVPTRKTRRRVRAGRRRGRRASGSRRRPGCRR